MERWDGGSHYERFMGRWSRLVAAEFVAGLELPDQGRCLDVGCGTGALLEAVQSRHTTAVLIGVDPSHEFVSVARSRLSSPAHLLVGSGEKLPFPNDRFEQVVSGLVLNFIPDPLAAVRDWKRVTRPDGLVHAYVWDYAIGMQYLRKFWDGAVALRAEAADLDEGVRFPLCQPDRLVDVFEEAGLIEVESGDVTIRTKFSSFDEVWDPLLGGQGPAPGYLASLTTDDRTQLREHLKATVAPSPDGSIELTARAWTVSGRA